MNIFKKLFGKKERPEPALPQLPDNNHPYDEIVDDYPDPFQIGVIYNNREENQAAEDD